MLYPYNCKDGAHPHKLNYSLIFKLFIHVKKGISNIIDIDHKHLSVLISHDVPHLYNFKLMTPG